ncbi:MAG: carbonic anhydrase [Methylobacter sp.]
MNNKIVLRLCLICLTHFLHMNASFAADEHADPHWTYNEQENWAELKDPLYKPPFPYAECGIGQKQSPIDIATTNLIKVEKIDELQPNYVEVPLSLTNNGHTIRANITNGTLNFGNNVYELVQFHFHAPSEHRINGQVYPMEIHFVNGTADGRMAVLGVMIVSGAFNPAFQEILDYSPTLSGQTNTPAISIQLNKLLPKHAQHFYTYAGSLTTPPCSEGVQWFILRDFLEVSGTQIKAFTNKFFSNNSRSEQQLNGRKVDVH